MLGYGITLRRLVAENLFVMFEIFNRSSRKIQYIKRKLQKNKKKKKPSNAKIC